MLLWDGVWSIWCLKILANLSHCCFRFCGWPLCFSTFSRANTSAMRSDHRTMYIQSLSASVTVVVKTNPVQDKGNRGVSLKILDVGCWKGRWRLKEVGKCKGAHELQRWSVLFLPEYYQLMPGFEIYTTAWKKALLPPVWCTPEAVAHCKLLSNVTTFWGWPSPKVPCSLCSSKGILR